MKFRFFTDADNEGRKVAVNVDAVETVSENAKCVSIYGPDGYLLVNVREDFDTVLARLNTIAG